MTGAAEALVLARVRGLGGRLVGRLLERFGRTAAILAASTDELLGVAGIGPALARRIGRARQDHGAWAAAELDRAAAAGVRIVGVGGDGYPPGLDQLPDPPPALWIMGPADPSASGLAIVGSRRATRYGSEQAERFGYAIASQGIPVVSGMARGIDTRAHEGALLAGGVTIAVLGSGVDVAYPRENRRLADRIAGSGALVSEHPLGTPPLAGHFPRRNRILAGLAWGVLVVEAAARSGSLITAEVARELGREVFAIPGPIDSPTSMGTNDLLKDAAHPVTSVADLVGNLPASARFAGEAVALGADERRVLAALSIGDDSFDALARTSGLAADRAAVLLSSLVLRGMVEERPGARYAVRPPLY